MDGKVFVFLLLTVSQCLCSDIDYLRTTILDNFSQIRHDTTNSDYKKAAANFIFQEFKNFGLDSQNQDFRHGDKMGINVIGVLKGENFGTSKDKIVGLGAHYDTVQNSPGVDDNGAGVAAMLNVAKEMTSNSLNKNRKYTVIFVSFDLEEQGLLGSEYFIQSWMAPYIHRNYGTSQPTALGVIIMDTMMEFNLSSHSQTVPQEAFALFQNYFPDVMSSLNGDSWRGDFITHAYRKNSQDTTLAEAFIKSWQSLNSDKYEIESFPLTLPPNVSVYPDLYQTELGDFLRSDHARFWNNGLPAIFLTDSANFRGDMITCYHNPCDNVVTMLTDDNLGFLAQTVDAIVLTLNNLSGLPAASSGGTGLSSCWLSILIGIVMVKSVY